MEQENKLIRKETETVSSLVKCKLLSMTSQRLTNITTTSNEETLAKALREKYSPSKITAEFNIDLQVIAMSACPTIDCCAEVESPMLCTLAKAFPSFITKDGERVENTAITWMEGHIVAVSNFVNVKQKMSDWQMRAMCQQLIADYPTVTMMEFVLFCARLRSGKYCSFYGTIDPLLIIKAFSDFIEDRRNDYMKKNEERRKLQEEKEAEEAKKNAKDLEWVKKQVAHGKLLNVARLMGIKIPKKFRKKDEEPEKNS